MKQRIATLLLVLTLLSGHAQAQHAERAKELSQDSTVMESTIYYSKSQGEWIERAYYKAIGCFLRWAQADTETPIVIVGWTDESGAEAFNSELSLRRARTVQRYLVKQGIAADRISFEGRGVDTQASSAEKARRADVRGVIRVVAEPQPTESAETVVEKPATEIESTETTKPLVKEEVQPAAQQKKEEAQPKASEPQSVQQSIPTATAAKQPEEATKKSSCRPFAWYAGIELGMPIGVSTFTVFTPNGGVGFEGGILGGYRFSPLLSLEASAMFGRMKLGASKCCEDYFLGADGVRYLEHVAGMQSYSYKDIYSSVSLQQYALRLNVDLLQIVNPDYQKRWSLSVSPAIYGIGTKTTLKTNENKTTITKRDGRFQFGAGVGIGAGYQLTENLGVGLRTGMVWVMGKGFDGIAPSDHKENGIWNNTVTVTWRFGCNK